MDKPPLDYRSIGPGGEGSFQENIPANTSFGELGRKRKLKRKVTGSKVLKARLNNSLNRSHGRLIKKIKNRSLNASFNSKTLRSNNQALARKLQQTLQELQLTQQKYCDLQREVQDLRIQNIQLQQQNAAVSQEEVEAEVMRRVKETNREIQVGLNELSLSMMHPVQLLERVIRLCAGDRRASSLATGRLSSYGRGSSGSHASRISAGRNSGSASDSFTAPEGNKEQPQVINRLTGRLPGMNQSRPSNEETAAASRQSAPLANLSIIEEQSFIEDIPFTDTKCSGRPALETVPEDDDGKTHGRSNRRTAGLLELPEGLKGNNRRTSMKALRVPVSKSLAETQVPESKPEANSQRSEAHHNKEDSAAVEKGAGKTSPGDEEMDADVGDLQSKDDEQVMDAEPAWDDAQIPDDLMQEPVEEKKVRKKKLTKKERMRMHGGGDTNADVDEDVGTEFPDETREKKRKGKARRKKEKKESQDEDVYKDPLDDVMADTEDADDVEEGNKRKSAAKVSRESEGRRRTKRLTVSLDKKKSTGLEEIIAESDKTVTSGQPEGSEIIEQCGDNLVTNDMITKDQEKKAKTKKKDSTKGIGRGKRPSSVARSLGVTDTAEMEVYHEPSDVEPEVNKLVQVAPRQKDEESNKPGIKRKTARSRRGTFVKEQNGQEEDSAAAAFLEVNTESEKQPQAGGARRKSTRTRRGTFMVEEAGTSKNKLDSQSEVHLKPIDDAKVDSSDCISAKEKEKLKSNNDKTARSKSRRGTYVMSKPAQKVDNDKEQHTEEREHEGENLPQDNTHQVPVSSCQGTYVLKQPNDIEVPRIALPEETDYVTQNTNSSPMKKACTAANIETEQSALDSTCLDTLDMEMTDVVNYSAFDIQAMMEKLRKKETDSKDTSEGTKVSKEDGRKTTDAEAGDGKKKAENKKTQLDVEKGKDSKGKDVKGKDKASLKSSDKSASTQKSQSKPSSSAANGDCKAAKGRIPVPTRSVSSDEEPAGGAAKFSVFSSKPGRLVFTAGRPDLAQMMNKKTKNKSTLPRPVSRPKQRTKTAEAPIVLQSPETGPKGVFQFIGTPPGGATEGKKNVYDLSMNESAVQPNVREFKKRCSMVVDGVLTEEQPAVAEQETLTAPESEELIESPHGIMLVLGNGRRTKPRARSKQVSYAQKLAQTKLTTPAQTPQVTGATEGPPDVSGTPTRPAVTTDAPDVDAETPVMDIEDKPEEKKENEATTEERSPAAALEKKKRKERPWEGKEQEAVTSDENLEAPAEKKKRRETSRETAEDVEVQEEVAEADEDKKKRKDKSLGAKDKEPVDHEKRCEAPVEKKKRREKSRGTAEDAEVQEEVPEAAEDKKKRKDKSLGAKEKEPVDHEKICDVPAERKKKRDKSKETTEDVVTQEEPAEPSEEKTTKRKEKQQETKAKENVNHDEICEAPVEKKKKKEKAKESTGDLVKPSEDQPGTSKDKKQTKGKGKRKTASQVKVVVEAAPEDEHDQVDMEEAPSGGKNPSPVPESRVSEQLSKPSVEKDEEKQSTDSISEPQSAMEEDQPRRRRRGAVVSYKEPSVGSKLRRGDPGTTTIYNKDGTTKKRKSGKPDS